MKRLLFIIVFLGVLSVPAWAGIETPKCSFFFSLKVSYTAIGWSDYAMTSLALTRYHDRIEEANPIARLYIRQPAIAVSWLLISDISVHVFGDWLYKKNRLAAFIVVGILTLARAYILYHNIQTVDRFCR